jgi:hypothetical protein
MQPYANVRARSGLLSTTGFARADIMVLKRIAIQSAVLIPNSYAAGFLVQDGLRLVIKAKKVTRFKKSEKPSSI